MALKPIQFKRSEVVGKKPAASDLQVGELAFNIVDRRIYTKNKAGAIVELANTIDVPLNLVGTTAESTLSVQGTSKTATFATSQKTSNGTVNITSTVAATTGDNYTTPASRVIQDSVKVSIAATTAAKADSIRAVSVYDGTENTAYITHAGSIFAGKSLTIGDKKDGHDSSNLVDIVPAETTPVVLNINSTNPSSDRTIIRVSEADTITSAYFIGGRVDWETVPSGYPGGTGNPAYYLNPTQYDSSIPSTPFPADIKKVETGAFDHNYFVLTNGELWASGNNSNGNMGLGNTDSPKALQRIATDVKDVFAGVYTTFIVKTNGEMYATGYNSYGALGLGHKNAANTWVKTSLTDVKLMACGQYSSIAITNSGETWVSGYNGHGRLLIPAEVTTWTKLARTDIVWASAAGENCLYVLADGSILGAGQNGYLQLGASGATSEGKPLKTTLPNGELAIQCVCTGDSSFVLASSGNVYACGYNINGQLGIGHSNTVSTWTQCKISNVAKLFTTYGQNGAVKLKNGEVWTVGYNAYGQLGTKNTQPQSAWVKFPLDGIRDFSIGRYHAIMTASPTKNKKSHNNKTTAGGATIKVLIPSPDTVEGAAKDWNTLMIHSSDQSTPILRVDGLGNVESTGSFFVGGKEVFHPGNIPPSSGRALTDNVFDLKDGASPIVFARSDAAKDKDNLTFVVEDAVTRITQNNDDISSALVFTLNNTDSKPGGIGAKNKHELIFSGGIDEATLTVDGHKVYHEGNYTAPDTADFLSKSKGGYMSASVGMGEGISTPQQPIYHQLNITRPLDTTKADSGILRIESKDTVVFDGNQQSLFKVVNTALAKKNAISVYENTNSRTFNLTTQGFCEANEFSAKTRMTVNSEYQGGMVLGLNKSVKGGEWFYIAPRIKDSSGELSLDTGKMLSYEVADDTWASVSKFTAYNDLLVGCAHTTRPKAAGYVDHRVTVSAGNNQNGLLVKTSHSSPSTLTLLHDTNANTGTMMRILSNTTLSPNAGAIATYPNFTATQQGSPSFQLMMNGNISSTGIMEIKTTKDDYVAKFLNQNTDVRKTGSGIQIATGTSGDLITGINYTGADITKPNTVFTVDAGGSITAEGGIRSNGLSYFGYTYPSGSLGTTGTGSGVSFEMEKTNKTTAKIDIGADTLTFSGFPANPAPGVYDSVKLMDISRISGNVDVPQGAFVSPNSVVHTIVGVSGGWARGATFKAYNTPLSETWGVNGKAGYGMYGSASTFDHFYVGFGASPWGVGAGAALVVQPSGSCLSLNGAFGTMSDERIKTDIHTTTPKLDDLLKVNVVNYRLKSNTDVKMLGVVAQELEQIFPNMIDEDKDGLKSVKYSVFTPMLVKGIQELHALKVEQDKRIEMLEYEIEELKAVKNLLPKLMEEIEKLKSSK